MDYVKYGKGLLLASLVPVVLLLLHVGALAPSTKCWTFQLALAAGCALALSIKCRWLRWLILASFLFKIALLESLNEQMGNTPLLNMAFSFILL